MEVGNMERVLHLMAEKGASDVYLTANAPIQLKINGQPIPTKPEPDYYVDERRQYEQAFEEDLLGVRHQILTNSNSPPGVQPFNGFPFASRGTETDPRPKRTRIDRCGDVVSDVSFIVVSCLKALW